MYCPTVILTPWTPISPITQVSTETTATKKLFRKNQVRQKSTQVLSTRARHMIGSMWRKTVQKVIMSL